MAKKVTKTQYRQAKTVVTTYAVQQAKSKAKKAHKSVAAATKQAGKKVAAGFKRLFK